MLNVTKIDSASSFEEGKALLQRERYDIAVLDIMGVQGYDLLEICNKQKIPAIMFTTHALTEIYLKKSAQKGAAYYAPEDQIKNIAIFIADVVEAKERNKSTWLKWFERLSDFYDQRFGGKHWRKKKREFWEKKFGIPLD